MACYGAPSTPVSSTLLRSLRTHIAKAVDPKAAHNRPLTLALNAVSKYSYDPIAFIVTERVLALRRCWVKAPQLRDDLCSVLAVMV